MPCRAARRIVARDAVVRARVLLKGTGLVLKVDGLGVTYMGRRREDAGLYGKPLGMR